MFDVELNHRVMASGFACRFRFECQAFFGMCMRRGRRERGGEIIYIFLVMGWSLYYAYIFKSCAFHVTYQVIQ